jgi:2-succinyl-6-hydroxy-2,4-cyclohexadiene-1-carboxylate synthase
VSATVVALHGFLGRGSDWNAVRGAGPGKTHWMCPDLFAPGAGDLFAVPHLEGKAWLAGYSFGARLALRWLTEQPERWHGALLLSVNPGNFQTDPEREVRRRSDRAWAADFRREAWDVLMTKWNSQDVFTGSPSPRRTEEDFDREKLAAALEKYSVADQFTEIARLSGDFLWMAGGNDVKFRRLLDEMRHTGFPGSFFAVPEAGHRLLADAPAAVAAALGRMVSVV